MSVNNIPIGGYGGILIVTLGYGGDPVPIFTVPPLDTCFSAPVGVKIYISGGTLKIDDKVVTAPVQFNEEGFFVLEHAQLGSTRTVKMAVVNPATVSAAIERVVSPGSDTTKFARLADELPRPLSSAAGSKPASDVSEARLQVSTNKAMVLTVRKKNEDGTMSDIGEVCASGAGSWESSELKLINNFNDIRLVLVLAQDTLIFGLPTEVASSEAPVVDLFDNLEMNYPFDYTNISTHAEDFSDKSRVGTKFLPFFTAGFNGGQALLINDTNYPDFPRIEALNSTTLHLQQEFTLACRVRYDSVHFGDAPFFGKSLFGSSNGFYLAINGGSLQFTVPGVGTIGTLLQPDGVWHWVTVTYKNGAAKLYVDGNLKNSAFLLYSVTNNRPITVGLLGGFSVSSGWAMAIDDAYVFSRALSKDEIQQLDKINRVLLLPTAPQTADDDQEYYPQSSGFATFVNQIIPDGFTTYEQQNLDHEFASNRVQDYIQTLPSAVIDSIHVQVNCAYLNTGPQLPPALFAPYLLRVSDKKRDLGSFKQDAASIFSWASRKLAKNPFNGATWSPGDLVGGNIRLGVRHEPSSGVTAVTAMRVIVNEVLP